jgi:hypothetical protein
MKPKKTNKKIQNCYKKKKKNIHPRIVARALNHDSERNGGAADEPVLFDERGDRARPRAERRLLGHLGEVRVRRDIGLGKHREMRLRRRRARGGRQRGKLDQIVTVRNTHRREPCQKCIQPRVAVGG